MPIDSSEWSSYGAKMDPALEAVSHHTHITHQNATHQRQLLPHLPPGKSFADYDTAATLRSSIATQVSQMLAAGVIKPIDWTAIGIEKKDIQIPVRDGSDIRAVVYRPATAGPAPSNPGPLLVYFHGGGWTFGWPEAWENGFEVLTTQLGITCVGVAYRLAPEHVFPTAAEDACDALQWCVEHAESVGADPDQGVVVAGTSAGACLAAVASHDAVGRGEMGVRGVVLMSAGLVHHDALPGEWRGHHKSWDEHKDAMVLDARGMDWFFGELWVWIQMRDDD